MLPRCMIRRLVAVLATVLLCITWTAPAAAQTYPEKLYDALSWTNLGPSRGGRSQAVAGSDARPLEYYFGATGGGLWKTPDAGTTWGPVTDGQIGSASIGAVQVCEADPDVVYIGTGETQLRGNIQQGDGVYKSTDAGKTWAHLGLKDTRHISRVRVHPDDPDTVFVAALGHAFGPNELLRYRYRGTDPDHPDNRRLRFAMKERLPLVYFHGLIPGRYVAAWPVFVVGDDRGGADVHSCGRRRASPLAVHARSGGTRQHGDRTAAVHHRGSSAAPPPTRVSGASPRRLPAAVCILPVPARGAAGRRSYRARRR